MKRPRFIGRGEGARPTNLRIGSQRWAKGGRRARVCAEGGGLRPVRRRALRAPTGRGRRAWACFGACVGALFDVWMLLCVLGCALARVTSAPGAAPPRRSPPRGQPPRGRGSFVGSGHFGVLLEHVLAILVSRGRRTTTALSASSAAAAWSRQRGRMQTRHSPRRRCGLAGCSPQWVSRGYPAAHCPVRCAPARLACGPIFPWRFPSRLPRASRGSIQNTAGRPAATRPTPGPTVLVWATQRAAGRTSTRRSARLVSSAGAGRCEEGCGG